jgi:hypothetical protein
VATYVGIGFSQDPQPTTAAHQAAEQAKMQLNQERIDLAFLFTTSHYDPEQILPVIYDTLDQTKVIGSSTAGIILTDRIENRGIGVCAICSEHIKFEAGHITHLNLQDVFSAGKILAKSNITDFGQQHRKLFIILADGLINNLNDLISGAKEQINNEFPIIGAKSSDDFRFRKTNQYYLNKILAKGAVGTILGDRPKLGFSCKHGFRPLGKPRFADQVDGHVIHTIDGKKAGMMYKEFFENHTQEIESIGYNILKTRYPLGLYTEYGREFMLRNIREITPEGDILCEDQIPKGAQVHIMIGNKDSCLRTAEEAALEVKKQLSGAPPRLLIIFNSIVRHKLLGRSVLNELQVVRDIFGEHVPLFGMYSFGEIFSYTSTDGTYCPCLQNGSIVLLGIH